MTIDVGQVAAVLLSDGWHRVKGGSFDIGPYEYTRFDHPDPGDEPETLFGGIDADEGAMANWIEGGVSVFCPLTSVLAVKYFAAPKGSARRDAGVGNAPAPRKKKRR